ncbi:mannose-1-phosphate guanyltransferase alpha-like, partial [Trifolium medium]|nr:mannose-1-phosphate guanyltransferase alpha-like [Trifolium medium]
SLTANYVRLDQDILSPLAGKKQLMSIKCSALYLSQFRHTAPHLLENGDGIKKAFIIGDVYIHPSAKVHSSAKIGPGVSISANARIGAGARLINCIVLDDVEIKASLHVN